LHDLRVGLLPEVVEECRTWAVALESKEGITEKPPAIEEEATKQSSRTFLDIFLH
jgi:hypothetical protein